MSEETFGPQGKRIEKPSYEEDIERFTRAFGFEPEPKYEPEEIPPESDWDDANRKNAFAEYFRRRKPNADALADLALENFIEMRDKTASRTFRAKKKLDHFLEAALPGIYIPLYTMVTFTRIPYATAAHRARIQDALVYAGLIVAMILLLALAIRLLP